MTKNRASQANMIGVKDVIYFKIPQEETSFPYVFHDVTYHAQYVDGEWVFSDGPEGKDVQLIDGFWAFTIPFKVKEEMKEKKEEAEDVPITSPEENPEAPPEEELSDEEEPPEEEETIPVAPLAPTNLVATVHKNGFLVTFTWENTNEQEVIYHLYVNGLFTGTSVTETSHISNEFLFNQAYRVAIAAFEPASGLTSELSDEVLFTLVLPDGSDDPRKWIYSYLDNFSVKYQK